MPRTSIKLKKNPRVFLALVLLGLFIGKAIGRFVMAEETPSLSIPLTQKLKSIPAIFGIRLSEAPPYEVMKTDGDKEIRKYRSFILASINVEGEFEEAFNEWINCY